MSIIQVDREHATAELVETLLRFHRALKLRGAQWSDLAGGLRRGDVVVLGVLGARGVLRPSQIAARLGCGPAVVSRQLAGLTEADLVRRVPDPEDRRAELVSLSEAGAARLAEVRDALAHRLADRLDGWPADDVRRATALVDALVERLLEPPTPLPVPTTSEDPA